MCGIGGKLSFSLKPDPGLADRMAACQTHRGPDASGVYATDQIVLAHRRLSVLDPSEAGRQPMATPDGNIRIVFNGEIYNYLELRDRLDTDSFRSDTDTEVLLALYQEFGIECLSLLRGMFAFAIWDEQKERLFLATDRLGQKPLFYHEDNDSFCFGSTIKAILADDAVGVAPDIRALKQYLTYQYVPSPLTGFDGIRRVEPGQYLLVDEDGTEMQNYWSVSFDEQSGASPAELAKRLREKLRDATRLRLRSDVPLGVFLSGGIDSSIVTALMDQVSTAPIETYAIGFDVDAYDELEYAREVADKYGTSHHEHVVTPDSTEVLPELVEHYEMPFGDPSALPTYYVSKVASADITVALTGDAGDENFAGYDRYSHDRLATGLARIPAPLRKVVAAVFCSLPDTARTRRPVDAAGRLLRSANSCAVERYAEFVCRGFGEEFTSLLTNGSGYDELSPLREAFERTDGPTRLDGLLQVDITTYLPDDLLVKVDRASMAHSLEVRSPFLDHEFISFAASIPASYKYRGRTQKWLLKQAFKNELPDRILKRPKQGFGVPTDEWFRGRLRDELHEALIRLGSRPSYNREELLMRYNRHVDGRSDLGRHLWDLLFLERWYERYID